MREVQNALLGNCKTRLAPNPVTTIGVMVIETGICGIWVMGRFQPFTLIMPGYLLDFYHPP